MATTCFPIAQGVPGLPGAPNWYDNSAAPPRPYDASTDDSRWRGAFSHTHGDGSIETASFRALNYTEGGVKGLYLSWVLRIDPTGPADSQLYVGLGNDATDPALIVRLSITTSTPTTAGTGYGVDVFVKPAGTTTFPTTASAEPDPAWITDRARMWVNYTPSTTPMLDWAIQMVVPLDQELSPEPTNSVVLPGAADFKFWYALYLGLTPVGDVIEITWPGTPGIETEFPEVADFVDVRAATSTSDPACTAEGISIAALNVGTKNVDGSARPSASRIQVDLISVPPTADDADEQNLFFADPDFPASMPVAEREAVRAHFRLANWGSHIGDLTSTSWSTLPGGDAVAYDDTVGECRFIWPTPADLGPSTPSTQLINDIRTGVKTQHQCMLVELSSVHPGGATFLRNSVYRNMDFEAASTFRREAEIALRLPNATSDSPRDVYLFEKTYNMPSVIERPDEGDDQGGDEPYEREGRRRSVAELAAFATSRGKRLDLAQIARWTPTYIVQAYHDTGRITTLFDENKRRILRPQTSFGYFMMHEGSLYGWQHHIEGAELIADNWYMLGVPENGAQRITTAIEAVEGIDDRGDETPGCLGALLILVRALWRAAGQLVRAIRQRLGGP